ncbi:phosphopantothenoylcysteine decarboxylase / phosphopantothenate---cysteine ligase [Gammaproteobacteria bacterium]|nr:bifunctional phosphopantothenoylcysteine decarboxylase/phosphopantothenate--cysteine ligase CoaBC [Gammaproteobacteria bacterium]CAG0943781.1 phosphopantothenoylcysteine decarboxylase / phosphopantothenate---cysteine ligase [Gammaproteobacteria bacterium]
MALLTGKKILLGVSGGIAAYKSPDLVRRLRDQGAEVQVVLTHSAARMVSPTVFQAVSGQPVRGDLWDAQAEAAMGHIELARWADFVVIAPATAHLMAQLAAGLAPDLLTTLCLATTAPVLLAPAMNHAMWAHAATRANRTLLAARGLRFVGPAEGAQACGESGPGRMSEPADIVAALAALAGMAGGALAGRRVLVTAGPTREPIDPVRFVSNRSSGKMGFAVAQAAAEAGARVTLVAGPAQLPTPPGVERVDVESAAEMHEATLSRAAQVDIYIGAAAVSDYRPAQSAAQKIKKKTETLDLHMVKCADVLAAVAALAQDRPFTVGFAAETEKLEEHALDKLRRKGLDMIVANLVGSQLGFDRDDNSAVLLWPGGREEIAQTSKAELARRIIASIAQRLPGAAGGVTPIRRPRLS